MTDNLAEMVMIVKDSGTKIIGMLESWVKHIDYFTIVDTGSTDQTVSTIKKVFKKHNYKNYAIHERDIVPYQKFTEQKIIDFGATRNMALDLAKKHCDWTLMMDDTYELVCTDKDKNGFRNMLKLIKDNDKIDSIHNVIRTTEIDENKQPLTAEYKSMRIVKTKFNFRWVYPIHEIWKVRETQANYHIDPYKSFYINDYVDDYHKTRSITRYKRDILVLLREAEDALEDDNTFYYTRLLFYIANTYVSLQDHSNAIKYYKMRLQYRQSQYDQKDLYNSFLRLGKLFGIAKKYQIALQYYNEAICNFNDLQDAYVEAAGLMMVQQKNAVAYMYLKRAADFGFIPNSEFANYNLITDTLPCALLELAAKYAEQPVVDKCIAYLKESGRWKPQYDIYTQMKVSKISNPKIQEVDADEDDQKKTIVFAMQRVSAYDWNGSTEHLRGSETTIKEISERLAAVGYDVYVFCGTPKQKQKRVKGVLYIDVSNMILWLQKRTKIDHFVIFRFVDISQDISPYRNIIKRMYLYTQDVSFLGNKFQLFQDNFGCSIFVSNFQQDHIVKEFGMDSRLKTYIIDNGVDIAYLKSKNLDELLKCKVKDRFIFSSDIFRGFKYLIALIPCILRFKPNATFSVFADFEKGDYSVCARNESEKREPLWIAYMIMQINQKYGREVIVNHGRTGKAKLYSEFEAAEYWFYPCNFAETFCITALEAQMFACKIVTNDLGALSEVIKSGKIMTYDSMIKLLEVYFNSCVAKNIFDEKMVSVMTGKIEGWFECADWKLQRGLDWALSHDYNKIIDKWTTLLRQFEPL
jgi:glycosyltransferase involved in cell wall biosynthesis